MRIVIRWNWRRRRSMNSKIVIRNIVWNRVMYTSRPRKDEKFTQVLNIVQVARKLASLKFVNIQITLA